MDIRKETGQLKPCPFCNAEMSEGDGWILHPDNSDVVDCPLGTISWRTGRFRAAWTTGTAFVAGEG